MLTRKHQCFLWTSDLCRNKYHVCDPIDIEQYLLHVSLQAFLTEEIITLDIFPFSFLK